MAEIRLELRDDVNKTLGNVDITSSDNFPLSLTYQNFDIRNFNSRGGSFSKTFKIPATKNNNVLFNHISKDGNIDSKNVRADIPATIYADNVPVIRGTLKLTKVLKQKEALEYECNFLGDNMDWASKIKNLEIKELAFARSDGSDYIFSNVQGLSGNNRDYNQQDSLDDKILYPLASYGEGVSSRNQVFDGDFAPAMYLKNIWDKIFSTQGYTVESEFCNSTFFKSLVVPFNFQKQSEQQNFKYGKIEKSDTYVDLTLFSEGTGDSDIVAHIGWNQYAVKRGTDNAGRLADNLSVIARYPFNGGTIIDDANVPASDDTGNVQKGTNGNGNLQGSSLIVKSNAGNHTIDFNVNLRLHGEAGSLKKINYRVFAEVWRFDNNFDADIANFYGAVQATEAGTNTNPNIERVWRSENFDFSENTDYDKIQNFTDSISVTGDSEDKYIFTVSVDVISFINNIGSSNINFGWAGGKLEISGNTEIETGEELTDLQFFLPRGKQSDFISGVAQMFNLQFETDVASKTVKVEPYDYFYKDFSDAIDWTDKVDYSRSIQDEFIYDIKSELKFQYKDASGDGFLERYNKKNDTDWGAYRELDSQGVFSDGEYKVENKYFSPTFNWYESDYIDRDNSHELQRRPFIPIYHSETSNLDAPANVERADKDFNIGARVLITLPLSAGTRQYLSSQSGKVTGYSRVSTNEVVPSDIFQKDFPRANFFHLDNARNDTDESDTFGSFTKLSIGTYNGSNIEIDPNLSFNNILFDNINSSTNEYDMKGLYYHFYSKMVEQLKQKPRIKNIYLRLDKTDVAVLDFQKLVYLDGFYYRINKIIDFKPHLKESTKVELVEYFDLGVSDNAGQVMNIKDRLNL